MEIVSQTPERENPAENFRLEWDMRTGARLQDRKLKYGVTGLGPLGVGDIAPPYTDIYRRQRTPTRAELVALFKGIVFTCANLNAWGVVNCPLKLYVQTSKGEPRPKRRTKAVSDKQQIYLRSQSSMSGRIPGDADVEEVTDHPWLDVMAHPCPWPGKGVQPSYMSWSFLTGVTSTYLDVVGNAFWHIGNRTRFGTPKEVWVIPAHMCYPWRDSPDTKELISYWLFTSGRMQTQLPANDVIQFKFPNLYEPYTLGYGPVQALIAQINTTEKMMSHQQNLLDNQARPDAMVSPGEVIGENEAIRLERKLNNKFRGAGYGGIFVTESNMHIEPFSWSPTELAALEFMGVNAEQVTLAFGVPLALLTKDTNLANLQASLVQHGRMGIKPRVTIRDETINQYIIPLYDDSGRLFVASDNPVPEDDDKNLRKRQVMMQAGVLQRDEWRKIEGLEEKDWASVPLMPAGMVPIGADGQPVQPDQGKQDQQQPQEPDATAPPAASAGLPPVLQTQQRADLLSTSGGVQGAIAIMSAAASGQVEKQDAAWLFSLFYGVPQAEAAQHMPDKQEQPSPFGGGPNGENPIPPRGAGGQGKPGASGGNGPPGAPGSEPGSAAGGSEGNQGGGKLPPKTGKKKKANKRGRSRPADCELTQRLVNIDLDGPDFDAEEKAFLDVCRKSEGKQIAWRAPKLDGKKDQQEIRRALEPLRDLGVKCTAQELTRCLKQGDLQFLEDSLWARLDNSESHEVRKLRDVLRIARRDGKKVRRILNEFINDEVRAPIILDLGDKAYLLNGNTRLCLARVCDVKPKVWYAKWTTAKTKALELLDTLPVVAQDDDVPVPFPVEDALEFTMPDAAEAMDAIQATVPLRGLVATLSCLDRSTVRQFVEGMASEPPLLLKHEDTLYIASGHHWLTAQWLLGADTAQVKLLDRSPENPVELPDDEDPVPDAKHFAAIAAWFKKAKPSKMRACVERKIPIFAHEHPDWEQDHVIAAAYGYCRQHAKKALAESGGATGGYTVPSPGATQSGGARQSQGAKPDDRPKCQTCGSKLKKSGKCPNCGKSKGATGDGPPVPPAGAPVTSVDTVTQPPQSTLDPQSGQLPTIPVDRLARADFITLPTLIPGTNCFNCKYVVEQGEQHACGYHEEEDLRGQLVTDRNCCKYWDNPDALRTWKADQDGKAVWIHPTIRLKDYNPNQPRDERGRFGSGGMVIVETEAQYNERTAGNKDYVSYQEFKQTRQKAEAKITAAPVPSKQAVKKAQKELRLARQGKIRPGGESRGGGAADRRRQRRNLHAEFQLPGKKHCCCHGCGLKLYAEPPANKPAARLERGKIFTKAQGGGYQLPNLLPECFACNRSRNDAPIRRENQ